MAVERDVVTQLKFLVKQGKTSPTKETIQLLGKEMEKAASEILLDIETTIHSKMRELQRQISEYYNTYLKPLVDEYEKLDKERKAAVDLLLDNYKEMIESLKVGERIVLKANDSVKKVFGVLSVTLVKEEELPALEELLDALIKYLDNFPRVKKKIEKFINDFIEEYKKTHGQVIRAIDVVFPGAPKAPPPKPRLESFLKEIGAYEILEQGIFRKIWDFLKRVFEGFTGFLRRVLGLEKEVDELVRIGNEVVRLAKG